MRKSFLETLGDPRSYYHRKDICLPLYIKPKPSVSPEDLAEKLISLKDIEEVFLSEERSGYLLKTKFYDQIDHGDAIRYIQKEIGSGFGTLSD